MVFVDENNMKTIGGFYIQSASTTVRNCHIEDYNQDQTQYKPRNNETDTNTLNGNTLN